MYNLLGYRFIDSETPSTPLGETSVHFLLLSDFAICWQLLDHLTAVRLISETLLMCLVSCN
jgi:hypothetical protein